MKTIDQFLCEFMKDNPALGGASLWLTIVREADWKAEVITELENKQGGIDG